jgi:hypothetical protein
VNGGGAELRRWLEYVAQTAIDWLDALDAATEELEDDELGDAPDGDGVPA